MFHDPNGYRFLRAVLPLIRSSGRSDLVTALRRDWPNERLVQLLSSPRTAVIKTAAACLGLTGTFGNGGALAALLQHRDPDVVRFAERGLWELWMNAGSAEGVRRLAGAIHKMDAGDRTCAEAELRELTEAEPAFAEPHHQRGIVLALLERPDEAVVHYRRCVSLNRFHFAAMSGLGSAFVATGDLPSALREYRRAMRIHPRLEGAAELVGHCQTAVGRLQPLT